MIASALFGRAAKARVEQARPADAHACARLHAAAFTHGWSELEFERLLAAASGFGEIARVAGEPAGVILSRVAADEAEVLTVVVGARWRRRGVARQLLERNVARLSAAKVRALFLEVGDDNAAARALYGRAGFREVGRRAAYYPGQRGGTAVDALVLRREIG